MANEHEKFGERITAPATIVIKEDGIVEQPEEFAGLREGGIDTPEKRGAVLKKRAVTPAEVPPR